MAVPSWKYTLAIALALTAACSKKSHPNYSPVITRLSAAPEVVAPGGTLDVAVAAWDPDGDALGYAWSVPAGWTVSGAANGPAVQLTAPSSFAQAAIVGVTVDDMHGHSVRDQVTVRTVSADAGSVRISSLAVVPNPVAPGGTIALEAAATSSASTSITYQWSVSDPAWTITGAGSSAKLVAPTAWDGLATVTVTADDGKGFPATAKSIVATMAKVAPTVSSLTAMPATVVPGGTVAVSANAAGAYGLAVTCAWSIAGTGWTITGTGANATVNAPVAKASAAVVTVTVTDAAGAATTRSVPVATSDGSVWISSLVAGPNPVSPGGTVSLEATAFSTASSTISYAWSVSDTAWTITGTGASAKLVAPAAWGRTATVTVTADDGFGFPATAKVIVTTPTASPPTISVLTASPAVADPGGTIAVASAASGANGLGISYAWSVAGTGWTIAGTGASAVVTAPLAKSSAAIVTVTVTDTAGASATRSVAVSTSAGTVSISSLAAAPNPVAPGGTVSLAAVASSTSSAAITYRWAVSDTAWTITGNGASASLVAPASWGRAVSVTVTADDGRGFPATSSVVVSTPNKTAPTIADLTATPSVVDPGATLAVNAVASGASGLAITYAWSISGTGWTIAGTGSSATVTAPLTRLSNAVVTLTVTDSAGASTTRTVSVVTNDTPPTKVTATIAGTPPIAGVVRRAVALDASGSSSTGGGLLTFAWRVTVAPAGENPVLQATGSGATATLTGSTPGSYGVAVTVTDSQGATATAATVVVLEGPATIAVASGDLQIGAAGSGLAQPLAAVVRSSSGATVPGVKVAWRIAGGRLTLADAVTDAGGIAHAEVLLPRIAGAGTATVVMADSPTTQATFRFSAVAGAQAAVAVRADQGTTATGLLVHVRVTDALGNDAPGGSSDAAQFSLSVKSPSGKALFATAVSNATGTLVSGGGTDTIVGQLGSGMLDILLGDTVAEDVTLTLKTAPGFVPLVPYSGWQAMLYDSADIGFASGWITAAGLAPWTVVGGAKAATPSRAFGIELTPANALAAGSSTMTYGFGTLSYPVTRLDFTHQATISSAYDSSARCTAQPAFRVALRNTSGAESPIRPAPLGGWPVQDACDGRGGFSTTAGFQQAVMDLTDATAAGYGSLAFDVSNAPVAATPSAASSWYVDDVLVQAFLPPVAAGSFITARVRPGPPASVALAATPPPPTLLYNACRSERPPVDVTARILDAYGNLTAESDMGFGFAWTGSAQIQPMLKGTIVQGGSASATARFDQGQAILRFSDAVNETATFTLSDPEARGLTLAAPVTGTFAQLYCHSTGVGRYWTDQVPLGTYDATEATRACETNYGVGRCTVGSNMAYPTGSGSTCGILLRWSHAAFTGTCNSFSAGNVSYGYWTNVGTSMCCGWFSCWPCGTYCAGGCGVEGSTAWVNYGTYGWN